METIQKHPILPIPAPDPHAFEFEGQTVYGQKGQTIAAALHRAGLVIHTHSLTGRERSLSCGIGKCGACEMLVDGKIRRICITKVDEVRHVARIPEHHLPEKNAMKRTEKDIVYKTRVAIVGAGPAGLAVREELNRYGVSNIVLDNNDTIGGQFVMQTHQFFFFEKEKRFGGMRGFDIAKLLAGDNHDGIMLNAVVWDILEGNRLAVKDIARQTIFYVDCQYLVVATGALPFMPAFKNDDLPGVYTAAVFQRMMNKELTLLGKNILTIGAGNIGYLTSYQAFQAGAKIKAILEAMPQEGGFPVQANRVRRLGIPILTSHILLEAIPNAYHTGIIGAVVARCEQFKPVPGTEKRLMGIDAINICTGLMPDNQLLRKGQACFGVRCLGVGDAIRIGEGTSAVLRGRQAAFEILQDAGIRYPYNTYLDVSGQYIASQQKPARILESARIPDTERRQKPFVVTDCLYGFACNPCSFACKHGAISKSATHTVPIVDYDKCIGCMDCVTQCPGLAIFGFNPGKNLVFLPIEYEVEKGRECALVDNGGQVIGQGLIENIAIKANKTNMARVKVMSLTPPSGLLDIRGLILPENLPGPIEWVTETKTDAPSYVCHCEDITAEELLKAIGPRKTITADELKHITRMGMGSCRGTRCLPRAKQLLQLHGIELLGTFTPRSPLANPIQMGELYPASGTEAVYTGAKEPEEIAVGALVGGGGMGGTSLYRYLAEAGFKPLLVNADRGSSWRCIAGGRPAFSLPAIADLARHNLEIFKTLQHVSNIDFRLTRYVNFAHDEATYKALDASRAWSDAYMVDAKDFSKEVSPYINPALKRYTHALVSNECWQASPGRTMDLLRHIGTEKGGTVLEQSRIVEVHKEKDEFHVLLQDWKQEYRRYRTPLFINAMGAEGDHFCRQMEMETGLYPVKHQAFITKRLPLLGKDGYCLDMLIDRCKYKNFSAVYGQQFLHTGQIIACASPAHDPQEAGKSLLFNTKDFLNIIAETFVNWFPALSGIGFQAAWCGYYTEPRYIVDPQRGLFLGLRGHGFMLSQYVAKLYVDSLLGRPVPDYFKEMALGGNGLSENAFK